MDLIQHASDYAALIGPTVLRGFIAQRPESEANGVERRVSISFNGDFIFNILHHTTKSAAFTVVPSTKLERVLPFV